MPDTCWMMLLNMLHELVFYFAVWKCGEYGGKEKGYLA